MLESIWSANPHPKLRIEGVSFLIARHLWPSVTC
jgi:hypothetical protein